MPVPHGVLVVGVGSIGERHLRCFRATGRTASLAFVEPNETLRRTVAERYQAPGFATLDEALEAGPPGVAVIATPAPSHIALATQLAEAGAHLLIEKPLSTSLDGIDRLEEVIRERGLVASVAYVYRVIPPLVQMRQAILSGRFGAPVELIAVCGQHFPTYRPAYREIYYTDRRRGGGAIQDALTHVLNAGEWLLGPIERLVADAAHQVLDGVEVEDTVHLLARHGRVMATYALNQYQAPNELTFTVVCEQGTARCELHQSRWRWTTRPDEPWHDEPSPALDRDGPFVLQANAFLDAVEGLAAPLCPLPEGLQTLRVNLAALASADGAGWQTISQPLEYGL